MARVISNEEVKEILDGRVVEVIEDKTTNMGGGIEVSLTGNAYYATLPDKFKDCEFIIFEEQDRNVICNDASSGIGTSLVTVLSASKTLRISNYIWRRNINFFTITITEIKLSGMTITVNDNVLTNKFIIKGFRVLPKGN